MHFSPLFLACCSWRHQKGLHFPFYRVTVFIYSNRKEAYHDYASFYSAALD
ncbi:hypothetical protein GCD22_02318 [Acidithiobacillus thiooxidans ATCC 19377]|uniref:Uncharacterized protein n=1 Tax=Acidithiobacillus thiooxidans ATCC 19377 TaxID=637390 RepID=A0A5P9XR87_ACITH|nr:hypothetical protein GCD22_02318 [Acidithiobacillus thiooxidans ATCC 19377]